MEKMTKSKGVKRLNSIIVWFGFGIGGLFSLQAHSAPPATAPTTAPVPVPSVDDSDLVQFFSDYVYKLDQAVYIWNWFNSSGHSPIWSTHISAQDPVGYDHFVDMSQNYWQSFCSKNSSINPADCTTGVNDPEGAGNMFGPGLYGAMDPVATVRYGGGAGWVLMQMHLPVGFRFINLQRDGNSLLPLKIQDKLDQFSCPKSWDDMQNALNAIMSANSAYLTGQSNYTTPMTNGAAPSTLADTCLLEIRRIFKDKLNIDAIYYSYNSTEFKECDLTTNASTYGGTSGNNPARMGAFVVANSRALNPADIRVFNSQTTDDIADRVYIESLFYKADVDSSSTAATAYYQNMTFPGYPGYTFNSVTQNCNVNNGTYTCTPAIYICPTAGGTCQIINPPSTPPPSVYQAVMSNQQPPKSQTLSSPGAAGSTLLWTDLDKTPTSTDLGSWVVNNLFGCKATLEYGAN